MPALPSCGLYDALMLMLLESLQNLDSALCKNKCVAFQAWLYNLLGGAAEKLVNPPRLGNLARRSLLKAATTGCNPFCKLAISKQRYVVNRATSAAALERTTAALNALFNLAGERRLLDSLSARLRGDTAQRVVPARGGASAVGGGGGADETPPKEVVHLRRELAKMQKEKLEASAAMVKLKLEHRDDVRELRQLQSHADAQEREFNAWLSTTRALHEAEQRESKQAQKALRRRVKEVTEKLKDETTEWSLYTNRLEKQHALMPNDRRGRSCGASTCRSISSGKGPVERPQRFRSTATELVDRVRNSRRGVLVAEVDRLVDQLRELTQRRTLHARRMSDANLEARRAAVCPKKLRELQEQHGELWSSDAVDYAQDYPRLAVRAQELEVHLKVLKAQVKAEDADMAELRRLLAPPPPMAQGAYDARMRLMAMELKGKANTCSTQVSCVIDIVARYYGIHIPERVKGKGDDARIIPYVPSPATCSRIRTEMGALSQLQVGEYIIEKGGSAGHFAIHSDGATSDGTEMSAFVLGQRSADATGASKTKNLLVEMKSSNDKTSETRAGDFREALRRIAELGKKAGMTKAELNGDLQPLAAMNDRAAPERLAARIILGTDLEGPTCSEHGALTNPMNAGTKAMDAIMQGWMGMTDEEIQLDSMSTALFMAVGWNASPVGALIYTPCPSTARSTATRVTRSARSTWATSSTPSSCFKQRMEWK